jgi:hypothetical protein
MRMSVQEIDPGSSARAALGLRADTAFFGVDIGSRQSKCCLINDGRWFLGLVPSGVDSQETAQDLLALSLKCAGISAGRVAWTVGTGYGRITLNFGAIPSETITEISCHGMGAHILQPHARTIVDIGGQDCKALPSLRCTQSNEPVIDRSMQSGTQTIPMGTSILAPLSYGETGIRKREMSGGTTARSPRGVPFGTHS